MLEKQTGYPMTREERRIVKSKVKQCRLQPLITKIKQIFIISYENRKHSVDDIGEIRFKFSQTKIIRVTIMRHFYVIFLFTLEKS